LKIDRMFVQDMENDTEDAVIVRSVVDLARNLGLQTVAEGVEDRATWEKLTSLGCDSAQGYFLARPMAAELFWGWLKEYRDAVESPEGGDDRRSAMAQIGLTPVHHR
jgi:EAL domain-containing protein (putative c-di-GMP-specific phosphodiesterase class I)